MNQLLEDVSIYMQDFAATQEQQKKEAKQKVEEDRKKGEEMRRLAMMSMLQCHSESMQLFGFKITCHCHAGRVPSPNTSSVDLEADDESDGDSLESSSKRMKLSKGTTLVTVQCTYQNTYAYKFTN